MKSILIAIIVSSIISTTGYKSIAYAPIEYRDNQENGENVNNLSGEKLYKKRLAAIAYKKGLTYEKVKEIEAVIGGGEFNKDICPNGESTWNPNAIGDGGKSYGLTQINLSAHPDITKEQALDPEFSLNFIVDQFLKGNEWKWSCYKMVK